jgi:hypothetical protein
MNVRFWQLFVNAIALAASGRQFAPFRGIFQHRSDQNAERLMD